MQTPKFLQNIKTRLFATGATTAGAIGATAYLTCIPAQQLTQSLESAVGTFLATVLMATAPPLANAFIGIATNLISGDLYDRFTSKDFYKQIPPEANLYQATFFAFQSILNEVIETQENRADKKQIKRLRDITLEDWLELVSLDEQKDNITEVAEAILSKFNDEKLIENQFLQGKSEAQENLLLRHDWLILLLRLQSKDDKYLPNDLEEKVLDALEKDFTTRLRSVFSAHQETFQEITLQLWETLFGKLEDIHKDLKDFRNEFKDSVSNSQSKPAKLKPQGLINLPREKNDFFVEQSNVFARLDARLEAHQLAYLHGTHGLGKTTTLNEYAFARVNDYDFVFYVLATNGAIDGEMARFADEFLENVSAEQTPAQKALQVRLYLEENERWTKESKNWLIIFDNLESKEHIAQYFPKSKKGDCLYACNEKLFIGNDREVEFEQFSQTEAELFVFQRLNNASEATHEDIPQESLADIKKLIARLGRLPLALNIAAAYLIETKNSIDDYVGLLNANVKKFLEYQDAHKEHQNDTAFEAFLITLDKISNYKGADADGEIVGKLAETFLGLLIFCAPEDIPEELIKDTLFQTVETSDTETPPKMLFNETVALLKRYGLIKDKKKPFKYKEKFEEPKTLADGTTAHWEEKETVIRVFDTYRALQDVLSVKLETEAKKSLFEKMLVVFNGLLPKPEVTTWEIFGKYAFHAFPITEQAEKLAISNYESWRVCNQFGYYFFHIAKYDEAEYLYQRGKTIAEEIYGKEHENTATSYNNLAELYRTQGRYEEAEPFYRKSLAINEKVLGENHPDTATGYNNLAELYRTQGRYEEAEPFYRKALAISEKVLGENHPDTATSYNNLALLYDSQGRSEEAEPLLKKALAIREKVLGENHPSTADSYNNLAELYRTQGRSEEAEPFYRKALAIREKVLGENHPSTAASYNNLALLYYSQGRYEEAEPFYRKSLAIFEKVLGENHPDTATSYNNLALLYDSQGRYEEAEPFYRKALAIFEKVLGENHPSTAQSYLNLGAFYYERGKSQDGLELCEKALRIYRNTLPAGHPTIQVCESWVEIIKNSMTE